MKKMWILILALVLSASVLAGCSSNQTTGTSVYEVKESVLDKIKRTGELRIGYGGYPPYTVVDPETRIMSGYSADLIRGIIKNWNRDVKIIWVETTWERFSLDLQSEKFDLVVEPIFYTVPRAAEIDYSEPYSYFGYAVGVVDEDEFRFNSIDDLNDPSIKIAVAQGVATKDYVDRNLPKATLIVIPNANVELTLQQVPFEKADVALVDVPSAQRFVEEQEGYKILFKESPPALTPAGFAFRQGDFKLSQFFDHSIKAMQTSGEIKALSEKYDVPYYEVNVIRS
jgi:ABC-type amino acid transport substrate-binding protein